MELITPSLTLEWLHDDQIAIFTFTDFNRQTTNAWMERVPQVAQSIPAGQTWYVLHDFGKAAIDFSFRDAVIKTFQYMPSDMSMFAALVTVNPIFLQLLRNSLMIAPSRRMIRDVFANRQTALKWLTMKADRI